MIEATAASVHNDPATYIWNTDRGRLWFTATYAYQSMTQPWAWDASAYFLTREEAEAYIARFPKSAGLRITTLAGSPQNMPGLPEGHDGVLFTARAYANLLSTKVTGERNEAGVTRYHKLLAAARKAGAPTGWFVNATNHVPTREAFEEAIA